MDSPCPHCGYCPHCKRANPPIYPQPYPYPTWTYPNTVPIPTWPPYTITCSTVPGDTGSVSIPANSYL